MPKLMKKKAGPDNRHQMLPSRVTKDLSRFISVISLLYLDQAGWAQLDCLPPLEFKPAVGITVWSIQCP